LTRADARSIALSLWQRGARSPFGGGGGCWHLQQDRCGPVGAIDRALIRQAGDSGSALHYLRPTTIGPLGLCYHNHSGFCGPGSPPGRQVARQLAAEITREKLYLRLHQELPYRSTVETDQWKELRDGSTRIEQTIYVERESQRKIVLGKGGATIKAIGADARRDIADMIEAPVHLFLFVKVREHWGDDPERYRGMGLEFPSE